MGKIFFILVTLPAIITSPGSAREKTLHFENADLPQVSVSWAKPIKGKPIRILAILPQSSSQDVLALRKRLDADIETIYTENSFNLGCDPLWGRWCPEYETGAYKKELALTKINQEWETIIVAGMDINTLPPEFWEKLLSKVREGSGLILIPYRNPISHPIVELIKSLEQVEFPVRRWELLCSGEEDSSKRVKNDIFIYCSQLEKGRTVYIENYLDGVATHSLIPDFLKEDKFSLYENAWAGLISLIIWSSSRDKEGRILSVQENVPKGPTEEEVPPELVSEDSLKLVQPVMGSSLTPFRIEYQVLGKTDANKIRVRVRREESPSGYEEYEFRILPKRKNEIGFTNIELPIGCPDYFLDVWLLKDGKVLDFFTKRFYHFSHPYIESVKTSKNFVYPHDSTMLKVNITPSQVDRGEASIVAQAYDLVISNLFPEGRLVAENIVYISSKGGEVDIPLRFADLCGSYLRIKVWGIPFKINKLGMNYSSLFTLKIVDLPIIRKVLKKEWNSFLAVNKVDEVNKKIIIQKLSQIFESGTYLPIENVFEESITNLGNHLFFQVWNDYNSTSTNRWKRIPCFNDDYFLQKSLIEIQEKLDNKNIPTPCGISLGLDASLTKLEEPICFCNFCSEKISKIWREEHNKDITDILVKVKEDLSQGVVSPEVLFHRKFMEDSFLNFITSLKNKCKLNYPEVPTGLGIYGGKEIYTGVNYETLLNVVDWVAIEPSEFSLRILPSLYQRKSDLYYKINFNNPDVSGQYLTDVLWRSLLEGGRGIFIENGLATNENSTAVKLIKTEDRLNPELRSFFSYLHELKYSGLADLFGKLKPDYNEEVAIYLSQENINISNLLENLDYKTSTINFMRILNGFGINPLVITKNTIEKLKSLRLLILPSCIFLNSEEIEAISDFLNAGGWVIADYMPGIVNEQDDDANIIDIFKNYKQNDVLLKGDVGEIIKKSEEKRVVLLGGEISKKWSEINPTMLSKTLGIFSELLSRVNISLPLGKKTKWEWANGKLFSFNKGQIYAWYPNAHSTIGENTLSNKKLDLGGFSERYVYDVLTGRIISKSKKGKNLEVKSDKNQIFSILPYEVIGLEIEMGREFKAGERITGKVKVLRKSGNKNENFIKHYIWIVLSSDEEGKNKIYSELVETNEVGEAPINIPTYLNQPAGWYILSGKEMFTYKKSILFVKILP